MRPAGGWHGTLGPRGAWVREAKRTILDALTDKSTLPKPALASAVQKIGQYAQEHPDVLEELGVGAETLKRITTEASA